MFSFLDKKDEGIFSKIIKEAKSMLGLQLDDNVSSSHSTENDVARVKYGLNKLNYYKEPKNLGMSTIPDSQMFDSVKKYQKDKGLHVDGLLKPQGETINSINNDLRKKTLQLGMPYTAGYLLGEAIGRSSSNLLNKKREMDKVNIIGGDNYYHRLAMCENAQKGILDTAVSFGLGVAKEAKDLYDKVPKQGWNKSWSDSKKDMSNNIEGLKYGLQNPDKDCKNWLGNLDYKNNKWKKK